jgi:hypothetical protein
MNATRKTLATAIVVAVAALLGACDRSPPAPTTSFNDPQGKTLSAAPAPSLAGMPIEETPETHKIAVAPPAPQEDTARDTPANQPAATLTEQKDKAELPLAGQVNNHSSDSFQAGRDEKSDVVPVDAKPDKPAT